MTGNPDFDLYQLSEEHSELRAAIRALALDKIAPRAAEIDETGEFPWDVYRALVASGFHAISIPEEYGGSGGDALAACIVVEEVARVCGSSSLIPAVNKLGTTPLLVGGDEAIKRRYLPEVASGEAMFSYALSEPEAGSDAASMKSRAVRDGDEWVLNGVKRWITNAGISKYYTVLASTDPAAGPKGISAFVVHDDDPGFSLGAPERKLGIKGSPTRELYFDNVRLPADRMIGAEGTGWVTAMKALDVTRVGIGAQAVGLAQGALDVAVAYS
ncbi:MAG: acyl-CoA dehydrogenase family protein, partial [Actinomycetes bacterium]